MGILQKADRCMDEAAALFGENKLFLAENKAQETAGLYKSCGAYEQMAKTVNLGSHICIYWRLKHVN